MANGGICSNDQVIFPEDTFSICDNSSDSDDVNLTELKLSENDNHISNGLTSCVMATESCYTCNGYYGPCHNDPVCSTCHAFLFPNTAPASDHPSSQEPNSSGSDSGNDEPVDAQDSNMSLYEEFIRTFVPVTAEILSRELHRLSTHVTHHLSDLKIEQLPPEVLMHMFSYLDEISLWSIGQVCRRWREVLFMCVKCERWKDFVRLRWPLLPIGMNNEQNWYELYSAMMLSACCLKCVKQMAAQKLPAQWEDNSWRRNRLRFELRVMRNDPLDGIEAKPLDVNCCHWQATIEGPAGSPYEGGLFFLYIQVPRTYPLDPPIVRFITKIFHPNVSRHGDIGIDSIHHNWSLALTISKLLISIQSLLTDPYCDVCMEPEIGNLYMSNRAAFDEQARLWTAHHAMHDMILH